MQRISTNDFIHSVVCCGKYYFIQKFWCKGREENHYQAPDLDMSRAFSDVGEKKSQEYSRYTTVSVQ